RVRVVPVLLREDVRDVLLGDGALPAADDRRGEPVGVALPRTGADPFEPLEAGRERQDDADARQVAELRTDADLVLDEDPAVVEGADRLPVQRVVPLPASRR